MIVEQIEFIYDSEKLEAGVDLKNNIKVPVVFCAEVVKFYSETGKYMFMPYSEIKDGIKWHKENMPRIPITMEHIQLFDGKEMHIPTSDEIIGYISQLTANDEKRRGQGWAYITRSKIHDQIADSLLRGHQVGVSIGGFAGKFGPPGFFGGQKYDASHMNLKFHHAAMIIMSIPRCPTGICGFNVKDSETLIEGVSNDMAKLMKKGMSQDQAVAISIVDYKKQMNYKDSFEISAEEPLTEFKDFHESLILNDLLSSKSCVRDFYKYYQDAFRTSKIDVINRNEGQIDNHNIIKSTKKIEAINLSEDQLKILNEQIKSLKNENDELKNSKFADAEKSIKDLQDANKEFADANSKLQASVATLQNDLLTYKQEEVTNMQRTLLDSKRYKPEEIKAMDYPALKSTYDVVKRFSDSNTGTVLRPKPANDFSTLPRPKAPEMKDSENALPARQYRLGIPPPMEVILDEKNDHWKPRYGQNGGK